MADWIMRVATRNPPLAQREWARAMQAEYDVLQAGRLVWSLGCFAAVMEWRFRTDGVYLLLLLAIAILVGTHSIDRLVVTGFLHSGISQLDLTKFFTSTGLFPTLIARTVVLCAIVSAYRPDRAFTTAATIIAVNYLVFGYHLATDPRILPLIEDAFRRGQAVRSHGAPMFVALGAEIGWSFVGCLIGITFNRFLTKRRS